MKHQRKPQSFASILEGSSFFSKRCSFPGCDKEAGPDQPVCENHQCTWVSSDGERCQEAISEGDPNTKRCPAHELTSLVIPVPEEVNQSVVAGESSTVANSTPLPEQQTPEVRKPKFSPPRRVRKTWELPSTGLDELARFSDELQVEVGIKISEAHHVSIALQVYSIFLSKCPGLLSKIDESLMGTETLPQAQDIVTRVIREMADHTIVEN